MPPNSLPPILAENFGNMWILVFGVPAVLLALAALSFIPSARAHWAGPAIAIPSALLSSLLFLGAAFGKLPCFLILLLLLAAVLGIASVAVWYEVRKLQ